MTDKKFEITKNAIDYYNLPKMVEKNADGGSYHLPGGQTWRNQIINMNPGDRFGPLASYTECLFTCVSGEFEIESDVGWTVHDLMVVPGVVEKNRKSIKLTQWDQANLTAQTAFTLVCEKKGTLQMIGSYGWPDQVFKK